MSGGPKKPNTQKDNLFSQDIVELALSFGEGVIWGLENGLEGFYVGEEAALDMSTGTPFYPFPDFSLSMRQGYVDDLPVEYILGGEANTIGGSAGTVLTENIARSFETSPALRGKIRAIDIRFAVQSLYSGDAEGNTSQRSCVFKIEYRRKLSDPEFKPLISKSLNDLLLSTKRVDFLKMVALGGGVSSMEFDIWPAAQLDQFEYDFWDEQIYLQTGERGLYDGSSMLRIYPELLGGGYVGKTPLQVANMFTNAVGVSSQSISDAAEAANYLLIPSQYHTIYGKTTSGYISELRVPLDLLPEDTEDDWVIQITRLTKTIGSEDAYNAANISLESIATIAEEKVSYPRICVAHILAQHTDRFSQIPDFSCDLMGLLCDIPINYNGFEGTYSGDWLGGYKKAWTDNPVWILRELIMNPDWGDRSREPSIQISDSSFYEAAQYCDVRVPKLGSLDMIRRHTLNMVVQEYRTSDDLKKFIAGSFRSILNEVNGKYYLNTDKQRPLSFFVCPEMVSSELFTYSATDLASRFNFMRVSFQSKENKYQEDNRVITNQEQIDKYGVISNDFQAVGVTNLDEALRQGVFNMTTNLKETLMVNFKIPRLGMFVGQYDNFLIADRTCGWGDSGRIFEQKGNLLKVLTPIGVGMGACRLTYHTLDGLREINCYQLDPYTFEIDPLEELVLLERDTPFILSSEEFGAPKAFRLMSVKDEGQGDGLIYTVEASEVYAEKYALTDALNQESLGLQFAADRLIYTARPRPPKPIAVFVTQLDFLSVGSSTIMYEITITMAEILTGYSYQVVWYHSDYSSDSEKRTVILDSPQGVLPAAGVLTEKTKLNFEVTLIDSFGNAGETFYWLNQAIGFKSGYERLRLIEITTDLYTDTISVRSEGISGLLTYSNASFKVSRPLGVDVLKVPMTLSEFNVSDTDNVASFEYTGLGIYSGFVEYLDKPPLENPVWNFSKPLVWFERLEPLVFTSVTRLGPDTCRVVWNTIPAIDTNLFQSFWVGVIDITNPLNPSQPYYVNTVSDERDFSHADIPLTGPAFATGTAFAFIFNFTYKPVALAGPPLGSSFDRTFISNLSPTFTL